MRFTDTVKVYLEPDEVVPGNLLKTATRIARTTGKSVQYIYNLIAQKLDDFQSGQGIRVGPFRIVASADQVPNNLKESDTMGPFEKQVESMVNEGFTWAHHFTPRDQIIQKALEHNVRVYIAYTQDLSMTFVGESWEDCANWLILGSDGKPVSDKKGNPIIKTRTVRFDPNNRLHYSNAALWYDMRRKRSKTFERPVEAMTEGVDDDLPTECPVCGGPGMYLGSLGNKEHFRCRNCGAEFSRDKGTGEEELESVN